MTENKKSAGYFDSNRNCPMFEGDVYFKEGYIEPYFRIVKTEEKGFIVHHIGSTETFALSSMGAELVQATYIGNQIDNPNVVAEHKAALEAAKNQPVCEIVEADAVTARTPKEIEEQINAEAEAKMEEEQVENDIAAASVEQAIDEVEKANEELKESNAALKENIETMFDVSEETEGENEQDGSNNSDVTDAENEQNPDELQTDGTGTVNAADTSEEQPAENSDKPAKKSNVIVAFPKEAVPEVIANTKEEKNAVQRRNFLSNLIKKNKDEIVKLEEKAEYHNELASTLDYKPFTKLKDLVCEDLHSKVDEENVKGIKERTKDFESIVSIQNLLKDHKQKALDAENHISDLEDEISKFEDEIAELEAKIDTFARQQKLDLAAAQETPAEPEAAEEKPVAEAAAEEPAMTDEEIENFDAAMGIKTEE